MIESKKGDYLLGTILIIGNIFALILLVLTGEAANKPINLLFWVPLFLIGPTIGLSAFVNTLKARFVLVCASILMFGIFLIGIGLVAIIDSEDLIFGIIMIVGSVIFIILLLSSIRDKYLKKMKEESIS